MAETLSPLLKQRGPFSPSSPFLLGSNDDKFERAQARAARAAAIRRNPVAAGGPPSMSTDYSCLKEHQILELFQNCIKLASENKINQKNTWELNLIDHLCEIVKVEQENDAETNFQKASCTLEAGVKIYSMRVDSVHSEAYKVLGGINRVGQEEVQDIASEDATNVDKQEERSSKIDDKKLSPLSTLESSFEALNVKKFDAAFAVDPLYHQTSAQFDEGGAKGLLLNNLGVYGNCQVLFDSLEVPGKCVSPSNQNYSSDSIDLSFAKECIEQMVLQMPKMNEISPSLRQIVSQFDDKNRGVYESYSYTSGENSFEQVDETFEDDFVVGSGNGVEKNGTWDLDHDDQVSVVDDGNDDGGSSSMLPDEHEKFDLFVDKFEPVDDYLLLSLGFPSKRNAWAGPDHWKYKKSKDSEILDKENASTLQEKKPKNRKTEIDIDFTTAFEMDTSAIFSSPKNPKSVLLPVNRVTCNTRLPEDCHYQPESLVKLFLLPNVMCLGRRQRKVSEEFGQNQNEEGPTPSWDNENEFGGGFDDDNIVINDDYDNAVDSTTLVSQPRQVSKIEVQYDKTSKQVDVQVLKETLWGNIKKIVVEPLQKGGEEKISFKEMLATFPSDCKASACIEDISPHLCFICLLHLANEHGLRINGHDNLDDLNIYL